LECWASADEAGVSPTYKPRAKGLAAMVKTIKAHAEQALAQG